MRNTLILLMVVLGISLSSCDQGGSKFEGLKTSDDSVSYAIGMDIGNNFTKFEEPLVADAVAQAIKDVKEGKLMMTDEQSKNVIAAWQVKMRNKQQAEKDASLGENMAKGIEFLEANKSKEGVQVHESGLQYKEITPGTGKSPVLTDKVKIHYTGTLIDGTKFDSSVDRGEPAVFDLAGLIQGWQIALPLMKEGAKWEIYVPSNLAYGERGSGPTIGPNSALIFQIELFEVNPK